MRMEDVPEQKVNPEQSPILETPEKVEQPHIPVLRTYRDDVVEAVKQGATIATAAAAETERRARAQEKVEVPSRASSVSLHRVLLFGGIAFVVLLMGVSAWLFFTRENNAPQTFTEQPPAFIFVEAKTELPTEGSEGGSLLARLAQSVTGSHLILGAVEQFYPTSLSGDVAHLLTTQEFLSALKTGAPDSLARSLSPQFLFGVHVFNGNQPLLVFKTLSYDNTFSAMLRWEESMQRDLAPAFGTALETLDRGTIATSTDAILSATAFEDAVIRNKDARVLRSRNGSIVLLYSFVDHETLVITTNEYTLAEVVSRMQSARLP